MTQEKEQCPFHREVSGGLEGCAEEQEALLDSDWGWGQERPSWSRYHRSVSWRLRERHCYCVRALLKLCGAPACPCDKNQAPWPGETSEVWSFSLKPQLTCCPHPCVPILLSLLTLCFSRSLCWNLLDQNFFGNLFKMELSGPIPRHFNWWVQRGI